MGSEQGRGFTFPPMSPAESKAEKQAKDQLREIAGELEGLRYRLLGVQAGLSTEEDSPELAIRADIDCVLADRLEPAIEALREAADPATAGHGCG